MKKAILSRIEKNKGFGAYCCVPDNLILAYIEETEMKEAEKIKLVPLLSTPFLRRVTDGDDVTAPEILSDAIIEQSRLSKLRTLKAFLVILVIIFLSIFAR
jgi:hypothetical protein